VNAPHRINVLGLTLGGVKPAVDGTLGLVTVSESAAAFEVGIDYNGDGDVGDQVAFLVNMAGSPGSTVNLGLAAGSVALRGTDAIIGVVEGGQFGTDFNGDSDVLDVVAFYVNLAGGAAAVRPLGTTYYDQVILRSPTELRIALLVPEQPFTLREDVNNDGDSDDNALLWFDIDTKETPPRVIAPTPQLIGIAAFTLDRPIVVDVDNLLFASSEKQAGIDFNGDGDTEDTMLRLAFRPPVD